MTLGAKMKNLTKRISRATIAIILLCLLTPTQGVEAAFPGSNGRLLWVQRVDNGSVLRVDPWNQPGGIISIPASEGYDWFGARYSADGSKIIAARGYIGEDITSWTVLMNADGSNSIDLSTLTDEKYRPHLYPSFHPNNQQVAVSVRGLTGCGYDYSIMSVDLSGANKQVITCISDGNDFYPVYSPDGSKIAFLRSQTDETAIYVANADGTNAQKRITISAEEWQSTGQAGSEVYLAMNGVDARMSHDGTINPLTSIDWSPDGQYIVYATHERTEDGTEETYTSRISTVDQFGSVEHIHQMTSVYDTANIGGTATVGRLVSPQFTPEGEVIYATVVDRRTIAPDAYNLWDFEAGDVAVSMSDVDGTNIQTLATSSYASTDWWWRYDFLLPTVQPLAVVAVDNGDGMSDNVVQAITPHAAHLANTGSSQLNVYSIAIVLCIVLSGSLLSYVYRSK